MQISKKRAVAAAVGLVMVGSAGTAGAASVFDVLDKPLGSQPISLCTTKFSARPADSGGCGRFEVKIQVASDAQAQELLARTQLLWSFVQGLQTRVQNLEAATQP